MEVDAEEPKPEAPPIINIAGYSTIDEFAKVKFHIALDQSTRRITLREKKLIFY